MPRELVGDLDIGLQEIAFALNDGDAAGSVGLDRGRGIKRDRHLAEHGARFRDSRYRKVPL